MSSLTIQLDPVALREATAQAIMGTLTPEVRAQLLQQAISNLLQPSTDRYERGQSPLQQAFNIAVNSVAMEIAREEVKASQEIRDKLRALVAEVAAKVLNQDVDKLTEKMAEAFVSGIMNEGRSRA